MQKPLYKKKWQSKETDIHAAGDIRTRNPKNRAASDTRHTPREHWDWQEDNFDEHPEVRYNEIRQMWLGWRRLINNKLRILQCIVIYSVECA